MIVVTLLNMIVVQPPVHEQAQNEAGPTLLNDTNAARSAYSGGRDFKCGGIRSSFTTGENS